MNTIKNKIKKSIWYLKYFGDAEATIRYSFLKYLLSNINKNISILDLGGGSRTIYPELYSNLRNNTVKITSVDTIFNNDIKSSFVEYLIPEKLDSGKKWDLVISLDTLEHIPPEKRHSFLENLDNHSNSTIYLAFPTGEKSNVQDLELKLLYKNTHGKDHHFLKEHIEYGLPDLKEVLNFFENKNYKIKTYKHMNLKYRYFFMNLWITKSILFRLLSPLIVFLGNFTNIGNCYRTYIKIQK